jgi:hypothetical protein
MPSQGVNPQKEIDKKSSFGFDVKEYYSIVRSEIEHEDDLINYRLTWLTYTQAILFAAFFAIGVAGHQSSEVLRRAYRMLPKIGFLSVCLILIGVLLASYRYSLVCEANLERSNDLLENSVFFPN